MFSITAMHLRSNNAFILLRDTNCYTSIYHKGIRYYMSSQDYKYKSLINICSNIDINNMAYKAPK